MENKLFITRINKSTPYDPIIRKINPVHKPNQFLSSFFNMIFTSTPSFRSDQIPTGLLTKTMYETLLSAKHATHPDHLILFLFFFLNNIWCGMETVKLLIMWVSPLNCCLVALRHEYSLCDKGVSIPSNTTMFAFI
jgi:hypothetical protein